MDPKQKSQLIGAVLGIVIGLASGLLGLQSTEIKKALVGDSCVQWAAE